MSPITITRVAPNQWRVLVNAQFATFGNVHAAKWYARSKGASGRWSREERPGHRKGKHIVYLDRTAHTSE